jgi:hypothetical protein
VDGHHPVPFVGFRIQQQFGQRMAGVVDQNVQPAVAPDRFRHHGTAGLGVGHVALNGEGPASPLLDLPDQRCRLFGVFPVANGHGGAVRRQSQCHRPPDAPGGAGDQRHLIA